ncbi:MAG: EamA family transporter [Synergistaceae bacterium]|nr:EamA family transporter [Synergistaceae bacterium]
MPLWGFLLSIVTAIMWAASPIMVGRGMDVSKCTSNEINPVRSISFFIFALSIALVYTKGSIPIVSSPKALLCIAGNVVMGYLVGDVLYFIAIKKIGVSLAVPVTNSYPMFVVLTSWLMLGEPITMQIVLGIIVVLSGLLLLRFGGDRDNPEKDDHRAKEIGFSRLMEGFLFAIGAGLSWAIGAPLTKMAMETSGLGPIEITFYRALVFLIISWSYRFLLVKYRPEMVMPLRRLPVKGWTYFLGAAVIGLGLGSIFYTTCINSMPVAVVTAITATSPFIAALFGHFVLNDRLRGLQWAGVVLIITGSVTVSI